MSTEEGTDNKTGKETSLESVLREIKLLKTEKDQVEVSSWATPMEVHKTIEHRMGTFFQLCRIECTWPVVPEHGRVSSKRVHGRGQGPIPKLLNPSLLPSSLPWQEGVASYSWCSAWGIFWLLSQHPRSSSKTKSLAMMYCLFHHFAFQNLVKIELNENKAKQEQQRGYPLHYGETIQFRHIITGKYICVSNTETSVTDSSKLRVMITAL